MHDSESIEVFSEDPTAADPLRLIGALTVELSDMYQDDGGSNSFDPNETNDRSLFVVARIDGRAVGCGAVRPIDVQTGEVKRMYVAPEVRHMGIGARILAELESAARAMGYARLRLETGLKQPGAIALYKSAGYLKVDCYGSYRTNPMSVCFEKQLSV